MRYMNVGQATIGAASFIAVWTAHASAQDAAHDWSGAFAGVSVGSLSTDGAGSLIYPQGVAGTDNVYFDGGIAYFSSDGATPTIPWAAAADLSQSGLLGSVNAGYNLQFGQWVIGAEIDGSFFKTDRVSWLSEEASDSGISRSLDIEGGLNQLYTMRLRAGVGIDRLLLFGTGGLAIGHASLSTSAILESDNGYGVAEWDGDISDWRFGYAIGGGAEVALTDRVSLKAEALFYDLGSLDVRANGSGVYSDTFSDPRPLNVAPYVANFDLSGALVRIGLTVHF